MGRAARHKVRLRSTLPAPSHRRCAHVTSERIASDWLIRLERHGTSVPTGGRKEVYTSFFLPKRRPETTRRNRLTKRAEDRLHVTVTPKVEGE